MLALVLPPRPAAAADDTLLLAVWVNGFYTGAIGEFVLRDGALLSRPAELSGLGFKIKANVTAGSDGLLNLATFPGMVWRVDANTQSLYITASNEELVPVVLAVGAKHPSASHAVESGTGAALDYDIAGTSAAGRTVASGLVDMRHFSPRGVASSGFLAYVGGGLGGPGTNSLVRLDTTYAYSDTSSQRRYYLGDFISGALAWTRPVRLGGVQVTSDFSMRPDLITFPLPSVSGSAAVPSTLDVLMNGTKLLSQPVKPGPFEIPQLPVIDGAGEITMTLTNALGKQVTVSQPFYASSALLAPGLKTWSAQVGEVRSDYAALGDHYGNGAASFTYRRGLSSWLTFESSAEATAGATMAGGGVVVNVANFAVLNAAASASIGMGRTGTQLTGGIQRVGRILSVTAAATIASKTYKDIAAALGAPVPALQLSTSFGLSLGRFGSLGITYAARDIPSAGRVPVQITTPGSAPGQTTSVAPSLDALQPTARARVVSVSYSTRFGKMSFYATGFRDFAPGGANQMTAGLTIPLGRRSSTSFNTGSGSGGSGTQIQATQSAVVIGDLGYQLFGATGNANHEFAQLNYKSPVAFVTGGVDRNAGATTLSLEARGAVSFADGAMFASNTINDSFAVVDTNGLAGVRVLSENRAAGVTNSSGKVLVPDLRSFDINHLAIVPADVPMDASIGFTTLDVRPQDRSGVVVNFHVRFSHAAVLSLVDAAGVAIPLRSSATLQSSGVAVPIGYGGEAYVEDLGPHNKLRVQLANGTACGVAFDYQPVKGQIPKIGPLRCLPDAR